MAAQACVGVDRARVAAFESGELDAREPMIVEAHTGPFMADEIACLRALGKVAPNVSVRCRRRDSNPRHADYDGRLFRRVAAATGVSAGFGRVGDGSWCRVWYPFGTDLRSAAAHVDAYVPDSGRTSDRGAC